jgi:fructose-1,6-bisphosphatase/inositol monophosphatase family enzyme
MNNMTPQLQLAILPMTGSAVGRIFKEAVRRSIVVIQKHRFDFEAQVKQSLDGNMDDVMTNADQAAQKIYVEILTEDFPSIGIVAEEDKLRKSCTLPGLNLYATVDPLDGTKAFTRKMSHGIGTMIALVNGTEVISAYIGDVMSPSSEQFRKFATAHGSNETEIARSICLASGIAR